MRIGVLSTLIATSVGAMVMAGPTLLAPAPGSPLRLGAGPSNVAIGDVNKTDVPTSS